MFDVFGIGPFSNTEILVCKRHTQAEAESMVKVLEGFGYTHVRVGQPQVHAMDKPAAEVVHEETHV